MNFSNCGESRPYERIASAVKLASSLAAKSLYFAVFVAVAVLRMLVTVCLFLIFVLVHGCLTVVSVREGWAPGQYCIPSGRKRWKSLAIDVTSVIAMMPSFVNSLVIVRDMLSCLFVTALRLSVTRDWKCVLSCP